MTVPLRDWSNTDKRDSGRAGRLAGSYVAAMAVVAGLIVVGIAFGGQIKKQLVEEETDVKFVPQAEKPPPPPPPPPPIVKKVAAVTKPPLGAAKSNGPPTEIPKGPPDEGDPNAPKAAVEIGDENGVAGGTGKVAPPAPPPPPPAAPPAPPMQVAEVSTAPVPITKSMPAYPEDARKQGIEAVVVVKFIVTETGEVLEPKVVKGHPMFDSLVLDAVRTWTFRPATLDGMPVRMARLVKIPFRLKAQNQ
jgi:protein TonB